MKKIQDLKELTSNILETMFYLMEETQPFNIQQNYKFAVSIKDDNIEVIMMFCRKTAILMAENFLGSDEIDEIEVHDTLKEAINIIAGNYVRNIFDGSNKRVGIPFIIEKISSIDISKYQSALLFYKEEPVCILVK